VCVIFYITNNGKNEIKFVFVFYGLNISDKKTNKIDIVSLEFYIMKKLKGVFIMNFIKLFFFLHIIFMTLGATFMIKAFIDIKLKAKKEFGNHRIEGKLGAFFGILGIMSSYTFTQLSSSSHLDSPHAMLGIFTVSLLIVSIVLAILGSKGNKIAFKLHRPIAFISMILFLMTYIFGILLAAAA